MRNKKVFWKKYLYNYVCKNIWYVVKYRFWIIDVSKVIFECEMRLWMMGKVYYNISSGNFYLVVIWGYSEKNEIIVRIGFKVLVV